MKLTTLIAQAQAALLNARQQAPDADPEVFVSLPGDEKDVLDTELFLGVIEPRHWFWELKTELEHDEQ